MTIFLCRGGLRGTAIDAERRLILVTMPLRVWSELFVPLDFVGALLAMDPGDIGDFVWLRVPCSNAIGGMMAAISVAVRQTISRSRKTLVFALVLTGEVFGVILALRRS